MYEIGQMVMCVRAPKWYKDRPNIPIIKGVYHVRESGVFDNAPACLLAEIVNPLTSAGIELGFWSDYFVPIRKPSIEIFKRMEIKEPA